MRARLTDVYWEWIERNPDATTRARVQVHVDRLLHGNPGRYRALPGGVCELKMDFGPGYRVYYVERRSEVVILCGGDKNTQQRDIQVAITLAREL